MQKMACFSKGNTRVLCTLSLSKASPFYFSEKNESYTVHHEKLGSSLGTLPQESRTQYHIGRKINDDARGKSGRVNERVDSSPSIPLSTSQLIPRVFMQMNRLITPFLEAKKLALGPCPRVTG